MDQDNFRLKDDDTMRRLRAIAATPNDFQWRMEILATLERMRLSNEVGLRSILQNQRQQSEILRKLTPVELAKSINREIDQREKNRDSERYRAGWKQFRNHLITAVTSIAVAYLLWRLKR